MSIAKIISGGQNGADRGGVRAAKERGIPTGGTMPKGWRTQAGSRPEYATLYGMVEHTSKEWGPRTFANVAEADLTIRIAFVIDSPGERLTLRAIEQLGKPHADIVLGDNRGTGYIVHEQAIFDAIEVLWDVETKLGRNAVINVAGNSERTAPGIGVVAESIVRLLIDGSCGGPL